MKISEKHREAILLRLKTDSSFVLGIQVKNGMSDDEMVEHAAKFMPDPDQPITSEE